MHTASDHCRKAHYCLSYTSDAASAVVGTDHLEVVYRLEAVGLIAHHALFQSASAFATASAGLTAPVTFPDGGWCDFCLTVRIKEAVVNQRP